MTGSPASIPQAVWILAQILSALLWPGRSLAHPHRETASASPSIAIETPSASGSRAIVHIPAWQCAAMSAVDSTEVVWAWEEEYGVRSQHHASSRPSHVILVVTENTCMTPCRDACTDPKQGAASASPTGSLQLR